ncbi:hypothetical protein [Halorubrum tebenquichense]|nr:hypothetical protein [Halorubrum tebenquichense]
MERWWAEVEELDVGCYGSTPERAVEHLIGSVRDDDGDGTLEQQIQEVA